MKDRCEHGVPWAMECLSCPPQQYVAATPPVSPSEQARAAAREWMNTHHASLETNQKREEVLAVIITRHFAATLDELNTAKEFIAEHVGVEPEMKREPKEID